MISEDWVSFKAYSSVSYQPSFFTSPQFLPLSIRISILSEERAHWMTNKQKMPTASFMIYGQRESVWDASPMAVHIVKRFSVMQSDCRYDCDLSKFQGRFFHSKKINAQVSFFVKPKFIGLFNCSHHNFNCHQNKTLPRTIKRAILWIELLEWIHLRRSP